MATSSVDGFLGTRWGSAFAELQSGWGLQPLGESNGAKVYLTNISSYAGIPIDYVLAMFRDDKLTGVAFRIHSDSSVLQLKGQFNQTYGGLAKAPTGETEAPPMPGGLKQKVYQWKTKQSTVHLMHVVHSTSLASVGRAGEGIPITYLLQLR